MDLWEVKKIMIGNRSYYLFYALFLFSFYIYFVKWVDFMSFDPAWFNDPACCAIFLLVLISILIYILWDP